MGRENRRYKREKTLTEVIYKNEKIQSFGGCLAKDISENGICIKVGEFFPIGTVLDLQFKLPPSQIAIYVKTKIVRINKSPYNDQWEAGLEILDNPSYAKLVKQYIAFKNM